MSTRVSIISPCRNEKAHIEAFLQSLLRQDQTGLEVEFLIADGRSNDGTREILQRYAQRYPALRLIDNPQQFVSSGLNRAIAAARGEIIIRMDVHTEYASDYVLQCVRALQRTGADNVGGPARTRAQGYWQTAVSLAYHSPFSCGGVRFHDPAYEGEVDTVTYGCWKKTTLAQLGFFDEELVRNQDDELNLRLIRAGGKIWQTPAIQSWYHPRSSLASVFRQYAQYGYWKVRVIQKHRLPASWRHLVPGLMVLSGLGLMTLSPVVPFARTLLFAFLAAYGFALLVASARATARVSWRYLPVLPIVFMCYHFGYGLGFLRGVLDFWILRRGAARPFTQLTRTAQTQP